MTKRGCFGGEDFRDPAAVRLLVGCNPAGHVIMCYCTTDRCNNKTIGGSEWPEFIGGHSPGTTPDDDSSSESPVTKPGDGNSTGNELPVTTAGDGGSSRLPGTKPDDDGSNGLPATKPGDGGSNGLPGTKPGDGGTNGLPGTKPKQPGKASFAPVTSPFGHVIMAVALFVTIVIGYLL